MQHNRFHMCPGSYKAPILTRHGAECPECRQPFSFGRLAGSAQNIPLHSPRQESDHDAAETATGVQ